MTVPARNPRGFTLVELVVVIGIFGIVMGAVYSLYLTHLKNAYSQEDLIDIQQNLRNAMDMITRDLRNAGALIPNGVNPLANATANSLEINTASASGRFARITESKAFAASPTYTIGVDTKESVDGLLGTGATTVRIIRPIDMSDPISTMGSYLVIDNSTDRETSAMVLKRPNNDPFFGEVSIAPGDVIAAAGPSPVNDRYDTITYSIAACDPTSSLQCLHRKVNNDDPAEIIAGPLSSLQFNYLYTRGGEDEPADGEDTIRGVRVTITAESAPTFGGKKTRQMTSVVTIRNRR